MYFKEGGCGFTVITIRFYIKRLLLSNSTALCVQKIQREVSQSPLQLPKDEKEDPAFHYVPAS